jgi:hypothetical protein
MGAGEVGDVFGHGQAGVPLNEDASEVLCGWPFLHGQAIRDERHGFRFAVRVGPYMARAQLSLKGLPDVGRDVVLAHVSFEHAAQEDFPKPI